MMKRLNYILSIVILLGITIFNSKWCAAQSEPIFHLKGKITNDNVPDSIVIRYTTDFEEQNNVFTRGILKSYKVENDRFEIGIDSVDKLFYLKFSSLKNMGFRRNDTYRRLSYFPILVSPNLDLQMEITADSVIFTGKDAPQIICQLELRRIEGLAAQKRNLLSNEANLIQSNQRDPHRRMRGHLLEFHEINNELIEEGRAIIERFSENSDREIWQQIWYDWVGTVKYYEINHIHLLHTKYSKKYRGAIEDFYIQFVLTDEMSETIANYRCNSFMFPQYLYYKSYSDLVFLLTRSGTYLKPNFDTLLDLLSARYTKTLFDQVAFSAILQQGGSKSIDENTYLKLISRLESLEYKRSVEEKLSRKSKYRKGYNFALVDSEGQIRTPQDFKGKVLIMDFWYTGCHGCKGLYKAMKPVKSKFKGDSSIVVLSVCVDNTKERWLKTISEPENGYTDSTNINVWLGTETKQSSLIRYYDIFSYPTVIILNGENEIVSYNPEFPYNELSQKSFIALINQARKRTGG